MRSKLEESHAWRHLREEHLVEASKEGVDLTRMFKWEIEKACKSSFDGAVSEAVLISLSVRDPGERTVNSREEWGSYQLPELSIKERQNRRARL